MSPENILQGLKSFDVGVKKTVSETKPRDYFLDLGNLGPSVHQPLPHYKTPLSCG